MTTLPAPRGTDQAALEKMIHQWGAKRPRNILRSVYYEGKNALLDFGISLPPKMRNIDVVLGWPFKAVNTLGARCQFDRFVSPSGEEDPYGVNALFVESGGDATLPQAITSALTHAVSFLTVTPGDTSAGEPEVLILPKSAAEATGLWDARTQSLSDGLSILSTDDGGMPDRLVWYARDHVTTFERRQGKWYADTQDNPTGRVWMEPLSFRPELHRPMGHSRISRAVMSLTDAGLRTLARSESHAEFFASPQRWALGADKEAFGIGEDRWNAVMSRFLVISKDEDGDTPTLGQFSQMSMQPHFDHLRTLASLFSGETGLALSSLGIVQDNPSSAEAIYAAKEDLVIEAKSAQRVWNAPLRRTAITAVMLRDDLTEVPEDLAGLRGNWLNAATPSIVSASDAIVKQVTAMPWIAESEVALEALGYDEGTIARLLADKRRSQGPSILAQLAGAQPVTTDDDAI